MYDRPSSGAGWRPETGTGPAKWFGKYRGTVTDNQDLTGSGKLEVSVPDVLKDKKRWASPCVPYVAPGHGLFFMPPNGTTVWVEFAGGDLSQPIWTGFEWGKGEAPASDPNQMVISTPSGVVKFNAGNTNGDVVIEAGSLSIVLRDDTVTLTASATSTIKMQGQSTAINGSGLEVT